MEIRGEGLADDADQTAGQGGKIMYVVHPNCAVGEL